jgi:hypothetical protein
VIRKAGEEDKKWWLIKWKGQTADGMERRGKRRKSFSPPFSILLVMVLSMRIFFVIFVGLIDGNGVLLFFSFLSYPFLPMCVCVGNEYQNE